VKTLFVESMYAGTHPHMQHDMETVAKMRQAPKLTEYGCKTRARNWFTK